MKILKILTIFSIITIIMVTLTRTKDINVFSTCSLNFNNRRVNKIAVIFFSSDDPYTKRIIESFKEIESEKQNQVKFTFLNPKNNIAIINELLDSALQEDNYDLFILYLPDRKESTIKEIVDKFFKNNKPLILQNVPTEIVLRISSKSDKIAFITPNSKKAGIAQGNIIVDLWNNNKKVLDKNGDNVLQYILLKGPQDDPQVVDRTNYVISTINDSGIKTEEIFTVNANWSKDLARTAIDNLFLRYSGDVEAIIANNDAMAIGAIEAIQKYGYNKDEKSENIVVVGIDGLPEAMNLIDKGIMTGTVIQDPKVQTKLLYTVGMNLINNLKPTKNTDYEIVEGQIIIPFPYDKYTGQIINP